MNGGRERHAVSADRGAREVPPCCLLGTPNQPHTAKIAAGELADLHCAEWAIGPNSGGDSDMDTWQQEIKGLENYETVQISGYKIFIPPPDPIPDEPFVGREEQKVQVEAAWSSLDGSPPLHIRLFGPPGSGKNALIYEMARIYRKDLYIWSGRKSMDAEDLVLTPVIDQHNSSNVCYVARPLFAAMYRGGIAFFDEMGKASETALHVLASVLDKRQILDSYMAGIRIKAASGFLFCGALNENEEMYLANPDNQFINERTSPKIYVGYPTMDELEQILNAHLAGVTNTWIKGFISLFNQVEMSPRLAIKLIQNAIKLHAQQHPKPNGLKVTSESAKKYLKISADGFSLDLSEKQVQPKPRKKMENAQHVYNLLPKNRKGALH